jgi:SET domain-containing protein
MFAVMKDTEYASKETFTNNFFNDWRNILGTKHVVKKFQLCDFTPIYEWHLQEKEKKKQMTTEVDSYGFLCNMYNLFCSSDLSKIWQLLFSVTLSPNLAE